MKRNSEQLQTTLIDRSILIENESKKRKYGSFILIKYRTADSALLMLKKKELSLQVNRMFKIHLKNDQNSPVGTINKQNPNSVDKFLEVL
jgi:hypothetical protein